MISHNFPQGSVITLTPWEPQELWPLVMAGLLARPAVLCPFVTRPAMTVPDRQALKLPSPYAAAKGLYAMRRSKGKATVVLQGSGVTVLFVNEVLPKLEEKGIKLNVFYVASSELFDRLSDKEKDELYPPELAQHAMGITDFTMATMNRWIHSEKGRRHSMHSFQDGAFLGSGAWQKVLEEGGLDAPSQLKSVLDWVKQIEG